jgi:hypothetical protein
MLPSPSVQSLRASLALTFHTFLLSTPDVLYAIVYAGNELRGSSLLAQTSGPHLLCERNFSGFPFASSANTGERTAEATRV